ncbi:MAG: hypothetical protein HQM08_03440 [Candidatus Riflebacteria bacterium]|nr:hypothetical protein [Candidatus Riflebacteria bacterium]
MAQDFEPKVLLKNLTLETLSSLSQELVGHELSKRVMNSGLVTQEQLEAIKSISEAEETFFHLHLIKLLPDQEIFICKVLAEIIGCDFILLNDWKIAARFVFWMSQNGM